MLGSKCNVNSKGVKMKVARGINKSGKWVKILTKLVRGNNFKKCLWYWVGFENGKSGSAMFILPQHI